MRYGEHMTSVRTTLVLDDYILARVRQLSHGNLSAYVNEALRVHLFEENKESMAGALRGKISIKDIREDEEHADLYR